MGAGNGIQIPPTGYSRPFPFQKRAHSRTSFIQDRVHTFDTERRDSYPPVRWTSRNFTSRESYPLKGRPSLLISLFERTLVRAMNSLSTAVAGSHVISAQTGAKCPGCNQRYRFPWTANLIWKSCKCDAASKFSTCLDGDLLLSSHFSDTRVVDNFLPFLFLFMSKVTKTTLDIP